MKKTIYRYLDQNGQVIGIVERIDGKNGKSYLPKFKGKHPNLEGGIDKDFIRPLYNLDRIAAASDDTEIIICEGEKAADAFTQLGCIATTTPGGSQAAHLADFSPLARFNTISFCPDNDEAGQKYMDEVYHLILKEQENAS